MACQKITKENFNELIVNGSKPVLLDFWAPWCVPCMQLGPTLEEIAEERKDILVGKVNIDEEMELAQRYRVLSIPTLLVVKNGSDITARAVGFRNRKEILAMLDK